VNQTPKHTVKLIRPHTHANTKHAAGATISVSAPEAKWLQDNGIAHKKQNRPTKPNTKGVKHE
jgi:hypothetical protein